MLTTWKAHTTSIKMKVTSLLAGFFLLDLWSSATEALINKQYLTPTIHKLSTKKFEEKNYANSKYEAFDVHDYYEHSKGNGKHKLSYTLKSDKNYSPSQKTSVDFPLDNVSYLNFEPSNGDSNQRGSTESNSPNSFFHATSNKQQNWEQFQNQQHAVSNFKGSLPAKFKIKKIVSEYQPIQEHRHKSLEISDLDNVVSFENPDSLSLQQQGSPQSSGHSLHNLISNVASGSLGHLSSHQHISTKLKPITDQKHNSKNDFLRKDEFKDPGYLPPFKGNNVEHQNKPFRPSTPFNVPDNSPTGKLQPITPSNLAPQKQHIQFSYEPNQFLKDPNNLPPLVSNNHIPEYQLQLQPLPAGYDFQRPPNAEQAIEELHRLPEESDKSFERPDYISNHIQEYQEQLQSSPLGYDFQKNSKGEQAIEELHKLPEELSISQIQSTGVEKFSSYESDKSFKDASYLSPLLDNHVLDFQQEFNSLPLGYDGDEKPPNAEQAIEELHKLPEELTINLLKVEQGTSLLNGHKNSYETNQAQITKTGDSLKLTALQHTQIKEIAQNHQAQRHQESDQNSIFQSLNQRHSKQLSESLVQEFNDINYVLRSKAPETFEGFEYLAPATGSQEFKGPEYLPPTTGPQAFKGSQYLPPDTGSLEFKGPDYLPPTTVSQAFQGSEYLPPDTGPLEFKGPDYLPPTTGSKAFKGSEYLPPPTESQAFKGSEYLPPTTGSQAFKGSEYLPPATGSLEFKGSEYLPPTTGPQVFKGSEYLPPSTESQEFKGSEYLPPATGSHEFKGGKNLPPATGSLEFKGPDYLPPTTASKAFKGLEYLPPPTGSVEFKGSEYLPPTTGSKAFKGSEYLPPTTGSQAFKGSEYLPPATESQSFNGPDYLPPTTGSQAFQVSEYLPPATGSQEYKGPQSLPPTTGSQEFKGSEYLPPVAEYLHPFEISQGSQVFKGPDYLPPTADSQRYSGSDLLTPVFPKKTASQTLSSYMENVNPYDRYGSQRIFFENDLPTIKTVKQSIQTVKIFNDRDIESNVNAQATLEQRYLPPRTKRNPKAKTKTNAKTK